MGRERQGIHFVEQHCTPVSLSNEPDPVVDGPGEGTATVTEKFDLVCRIGMDRSLQIRQEIEQKCKVTTIERRIHLGDAAQDSVSYAGQASP